MSAIDQVTNDSQEQHQRYLDLYGVNPASGEGFRDLADSAKQLVEQITDARNDVEALRFSTEVEGRYAQATASDPQPVATTAHVARVAARTADTSAQINREGSAAILANANGEINQISAVPDRDSPEGQAAILNIIAEHQAQSVQTVTSSAAAQQAAGAQAAATGGAPGGGAAAGGGAGAALGEMLPAVESALSVAPQAAMSMLPAVAGMATAPFAALSAVAAPPSGEHQSAPTQHSNPPAPTTQPGIGGGSATSPHTPQGSAGAGGQASPHSSQAPVGPSAPTTPPNGNDQHHSKDDQHVQLAGFGSGQHPPESPQHPDPPHGHDPRYWLDTKQIVTVPPGQLAPAGYKQIGPGMYYPWTDPQLFATPDPPSPAQLPVDMRDILHLKPGELPPIGYREMAPNTYFPVPHGDVPPGWPTPRQPIDVRDIIHTAPGELVPPGYVEYTPGWWAPNITSPNISAVVEMQ